MCSSDLRWTWSRETWDAVRRGQAVPPAFAVRVDGHDLLLANTGGDGLAPIVELHGRIDAWDTVADWSGEVTADGLRLDPPARRIPGGGTMPIGWARGAFVAEVE